MARAKDYQVGHKVLLVLPEGERSTMPEGLKKWHEVSFRISRVAKVPSGNHFETYYELRGCKSQEGVPYAISPDWLYDVSVWTE